MLALINKLSKVSLLFVFLVIVAGSVVRMTGSGMGCPDWPKCFGYYIPPTDAAQVIWEPQRDFEQGQMILLKDALWKAKGDFTSGDDIDLNNWEKYEEHDYAIFNVTHTWIEYINRLLGAATGFPVLLLFGSCLIYGIRERKWKLFLLAGAVMFFLGFEAWLGKKVVDGNLIPGHISMHMAGSVVLIVLLVYMIKVSATKAQSLEVDRRTKLILIAMIALSALQVFWGTQVREEVDVLLKAAVGRDSIIASLPSIFKLHRSFSILVLALHVWFFLRIRKLQISNRWVSGLMVLLGAEILAGVVLAYLSMPAGFQPMHLTFALIMLGVQTHLLVNTTSLKTT